MDPEKVKSIPEKYRSSVHLTLRVSPDVKNWLVENHYSPTKIFHEAIKELGYKEGIVEDHNDNELNEDNLPEGEEIYYKKVRVNTRHGFRTKMIKHTRPKKYGIGNRNVKTQKKRVKGRIRSRR